MSIDTKRLRELAEAPFDHQFVTVRKDELLALLDEVERLRSNAEHSRDQMIREVSDSRRIQQQLAAMTAARDEACEIADGVLHGHVDAIRDYHNVNTRVAALKKVGQP